MGSESEIIALIKGLKTSLSGLAISDSITAQISGQTIIAKISGETIIVASGQLIAKISGEVVIGKISGEIVVAKISGETLGLSSGTGPIIARISGQTVICYGEMDVINQVAVAGMWVLPTSPYGNQGASLQQRQGTNELLVQICQSGIEIDPRAISGQTVVGKVSGETIDIKVPTAVKTGLIRIVTASSGGAVLHSGTVNAVIIKADANNSGDIYVGGVLNRPYSGFGFPLAKSEAVNVNVDNFNQIYVCATVSGEKVGFLGVA